MELSPTVAILAALAIGQFFRPTVLEGMARSTGLPTSPRIPRKLLILRMARMGKMETSAGSRYAAGTRPDSKRNLITR